MTMAHTGNSNSSPPRKRSPEVADILREHITEYRETYPLQPHQYKIVSDLITCRTSYRGGRIEKCDHCGAERITYNSCRNRHCPKCQNIPRERWLEARKAELLPVSYFHTVFTLPHELNPIILRNKETMLTILFTAVAQTLLSFGRNPRNGLGGQMGFIAILHTWDQKLNAHFHLHCLIPGGAMTGDGQQWKPCTNHYLFNEEALGLVFRGKFIEYLTEAYQNGTLQFPGIIAPYKKPQRFSELISSLYSRKWVVSVREPIKRPEYVLEYLGRYTHRVALSNQRIVALENGMVTFTYRNRNTNRIGRITIAAVEFIRRFLLHVLPHGFVRIRHFGFLANRYKTKHLARLRCLLGRAPGMHEPVEHTLREMMLLLTGIDVRICPYCKKGKMRLFAPIPGYTGLGAKQIIQGAIPDRAAA
jgi:hypothetical protein